MVDPTATGDRIETRKDFGDDDGGLYAYWLAQDAIAEKEERKWVKKARDIVKRYRDERPEAAQSTNRMNILWSNVQTLKPTLYGRTPKPDVERRFKDADPTGRLSATLLERCLQFSLDAGEFDRVMESVVEDKLLPGRGVARVLYVPHFGDAIKNDINAQNGPDQDKFEEEEAADTVITNPGDKEDSSKKEEPLREVVYEEVVPAYVFWEDYREGAARTWREVPWVRYRSYLTLEELTNRFGEKKADQVSLDFTPKGMAETNKDTYPPPDVYKKAIVWEIWDRTRLQVVWLAPGTPDLILDKRDDPLRLPDFFPSPDPLLATTTNDKRIPVPDYIEYQDQARELDSLTSRIDRLTRALKVSGVYAGDEKQVLQQLIDEGTENRLIPVGDVQSWADKGGMKGIIEWMPIEQIAQTLIQLYSARDRVKNLLYELTGIGDILRGMTSPDETLGAQELKANFATRRISPQQKNVGKFARDLLRLMAGIISEHFDPKTITMITGYPQLDPVPPLPPQPQAPPAAMAQPGGPPAPGSPGVAPNAPPDPAMQAFQQQMAQYQQAVQQAQQVQQSNQAKQQQFDAAVKLIKEDGVHGFRIDIEADSTIAPDEQAEKHARIEFMQQFVPYMQQIIPLAQGNPTMAQLAEEMTLFVVRGFRVARPLEETITKAFQVFGKMPPPPPKGGSNAENPQEIAVRGQEVQAENNKSSMQMQVAQLRASTEMAKLGQQTQFDAAKLAHEQVKDRVQAALEIEKEQSERAFRQTRASNIESREASRLT